MGSKQLGKLSRVHKQNQGCTHFNLVVLGRETDSERRGNSLKRRPRPLSVKWIVFVLCNWLRQAHAKLDLVWPSLQQLAGVTAIHLHNNLVSTSRTILFPTVRPAHQLLFCLHSLESTIVLFALSYFYFSPGAGLD